MNCATRLIALLEEKDKEKDYFKAVSYITGISDRFEQFLVFKYFLQDIEKIKKDAIAKDRFTPTLNVRLYKIGEAISPYLAHDTNKIRSAIDDLHMFNLAIKDEINYIDDLEKIKLQLENTQTDDVILKDILQDISDAIKYYGYFGDTVLQEKFFEVSGKVVAYQDTVKTSPKKIVALIVAFTLIGAEIVAKTAEVSENIVSIKENIIKMLGHNNGK